MSIAIRPADLESDRKLLMDTLSRYLPRRTDDRTFDWLYRENPHGKARAWIAWDTGNQSVVGVAGAFPRRMYVGKREEVGWVLGDFCISDRYRSLGPASQLYRSYLAEVDSGKMAFCYDFPSPTMMAVYKRLLINPFTQMLRLAKPLRMDGKVGEIIKSQRLARGLSAAGNFLLALERKRTSRRGIQCSLYTEACGEEFSELEREISGRYGICTQRSAEYLNWRYLANPLCRYELLTARHDGRLVAYAVFSHSGQNAILADLFGVDDLRIITGLVQKVVTILRKRGAATVSAPMLELHPWVEPLKRLGFRIREASPVTVYGPVHARFNRSGTEGLSWCLMQGDRDS